jgi:hypothetical protein
MRDLTSLEMKAVSGGLAQPKPIGRHPLLRLLVGLILLALHFRKPTPEKLILT